jgi:hypothetical protein
LGGAATRRAPPGSGNASDASESVDVVRRERLLERCDAEVFQFARGAERDADGIALVGVDPQERILAGGGGTHSTVRTSSRPPVHVDLHLEGAVAATAAFGYRGFDAAGPSDDTFRSSRIVSTR